MPWHIDPENPACAGFAVVKDADGKVVGCHPTKEKALAQLAALNINVKEASMADETERAEWDTAYINDLPDSAFACILPGGTKDESGKTTPRSLRKYPHHDASGAVDPAHLANARARVQQEGTTSCGHDHLFNAHALPSDSTSSAEPAGEERQRPPKEGYRAISWAAEYREQANTPPRLVGHFARFGVYNEIDSIKEGRFLERIQPGAFARTFKNNGDRIRVLFQHGKDPHVGDKPIAAPTVLREDKVGPYYEAELLEGVDPLIVAGLRSGQYGVSYRFSVVSEDWEPAPGKSDANPLGLPTRDILEARVYEFGPVTFPADAGADVAVRSLTDQMNPPEVRADPEPQAPSPEPEAPPHLVSEARDEPDPPPDAAPIHKDPPEGGSSDSRRVAVAPDISAFTTREDKVARVTEIERELETIAKQFDGVLPEEPQARWDGYVAEKNALVAAIEAVDARNRELARNLSRAWEERTPTSVVPGYAPPNIIKTRDLASIYDVQRTIRESRNTAEMETNLRDNAMRAIEGAQFQATERAKGQAQVENIVNGGNSWDQISKPEAAKRVLYTGSPAYRRAYHKFLVQGPEGPQFTPEESAAFHEARTALVTASNTAVPFDLDPTMVINTSGAVNPFRAAFRIVRTTSNDWRPSVSSGMTAVYEDEATAATDLSPAFTAEARLLVKAHTAAMYSVEIEGDYSLGSLEAEITREIADAKDVLEATEFSTGGGSTHHPMGIFSYYTANFLDTATTLVIVAADLYKLEANIGPRYRGNTVWLGSPYFYSLVRGIDTAGGAALWVPNLTQGNYGTMGNNGRLADLIGHPAYECIAPANTSMATTEKVAILADRDRFVIIDRVGMNVELIPNFLSASTGYPTGQRIVYAWWRNTSDGIGLATLGAGREACIFRGK